MMAKCLLCSEMMHICLTYVDLDALLASRPTSKGSKYTIAVLSSLLGFDESTISVIGKHRVSFVKLQGMFHLNFSFKFTPSFHGNAM